MLSFRPRHLECSSKVRGVDGAHELVVVALALFPFEAPEALRPASELRHVIETELGEGATVDAGVPKHGSEILVYGSCYVPGGVHRTSSSVRVQLGAIDKSLYIVGDRFWRGEEATEPQPFRVMPIDYRHAFGGAGYADNPRGKGFVPIELEGGSIRPLPNVQDAARPVRSSKDTVEPAGFGPLPRAEGPNVAPCDQRLEGALPAGQKFVIENMHPDKPRLEGALPDIVCRGFALQFAEGKAVLHEIHLELDTAWLFPRVERGVVAYRGRFPIESVEAAEVLPVLVAFEDRRAPKSIAHYAKALMGRFRSGGKVESDADLVPDWADPAPAQDEEPDPSGTERRKAEVRAAAQAVLDNIREQLQGRRIDADKYLPESLPEPGEPPPPKQPGDVRAEVEAKQATLEATLRQRLAGTKIDAEAALAKEPVAGPPPRFSAQAELDKLRTQLEQAKKAKLPARELENKLADPAFERQLVDAEQKLAVNYRRTAHFYPAFELDPRAAAKLRDAVVAAREAGEPLAGLDLAGADLSGLDLEGADLHGALLECAKFGGAKLGGADLSRAVLAHADLADTDLHDCRFVDANLGHAKLAGANLAGSDLSGAVLAGADLTGTVRSGATLPFDPTGARAAKAELDAMTTEDNR